MCNSYISLEQRYKKFLARVIQERKKAKLTQEMLAEKLCELGYERDQSAISEWENNKRPIPIDAVFVLSRVFGCDCGYLLCDYDERIHNATDICAATGLSEETVNTLCNAKSWGYGQELVSVIDALIYDFRYATKGEHMAPLSFLISWFLRYKGNGKGAKQVLVNGEIRDCPDTSGYVSSTLKLNDRIIENAALTEIQQALISLKKRILRKERRNNG